jgi:O-Antigen ligase
MTYRLKVILTFLLGTIGGTGAYGLSSLLMNLLVVSSFALISWEMIQRYNYEKRLIEISVKKFLVFILYSTFLLANILKEVIYDSEYQYSGYQVYFGFEDVGGILRQYSDMFRGFIVFLAAALVYAPVRHSKALIILPPLCLTIVFAGQVAEAYGLISFNQELAEGDTWGATFTDKLLARPGGFLNANMTAAVGLIWFYVTLESDLKVPVILKGYALILVLAICLLTQSRGALIFLSLFTVYSLIISRNFSFLVSIVVGGLGVVVVLSYLDIEILNGLIEKFSARASKESSADERAFLIMKAIEYFQNSPIHGNGLFYLMKAEGHSSHNQTLEILSNFGIIGLIVFLSFYFTFYHRNYIPYILVCVLPMFLFSHNFFENSAFQVAIGFGYSQIRNKT